MNTSMCYLFIFDYGTFSFLLLEYSKKHFSVKESTCNLYSEHFDAKFSSFHILELWLLCSFRQRCKIIGKKVLIKKYIFLSFKVTNNGFHFKTCTTYSYFHTWFRMYFCNCNSIIYYNIFSCYWKNKYAYNL